MVQLHHILHKFEEAGIERSEYSIRELNVKLTDDLMVIVSVEPLWTSAVLVPLPHIKLVYQNPDDSNNDNSYRWPNGLIMSEDGLNNELPLNKRETIKMLDFEIMLKLVKPILSA